MAPPVCEESLDEVRRLTLEKIGRNLVNFQKMEAMLKCILTLANVEGPASAMAEVLAQRKTEVQRRTMGRLVNEAAPLFHPGLQSDDVPPIKREEIWFSISLVLGNAKTDATIWRNAMLAVVEERNRLVHQMSPAFNPNSIDSCKSLCQSLDQQRESCITAYAHLESVLRGVQQSFQEIPSI